MFDLWVFSLHLCQFLEHPEDFLVWSLGIFSPPVVSLSSQSTPADCVSNIRTKGNTCFLFFTFVSLLVFFEFILGPYLRSTADHI